MTPPVSTTYCTIMYNYLTIVKTYIYIAKGIGIGTEDDHQSNTETLEKDKATGLIKPL